MKLRIFTWVHDRKATRWRHWPVVGVVRAYAIGYVEGRRCGSEGLPGLFGAVDRRTGRLNMKGRVPRAYSRGRAVGARERRERSSLRLVA